MMNIQYMNDSRMKQGKKAGLFLLHQAAVENLYFHLNAFITFNSFKIGREQSLSSQASDSVCECFETCQSADILHSWQGHTLLELHAPLAEHLGVCGTRGCPDREVLCCSTCTASGTGEAPVKAPGLLKAKSLNGTLKCLLLV